MNNPKGRAAIKAGSHALTKAAELVNPIKFTVVLAANIDSHKETPYKRQ